MVLRKNVNGSNPLLKLELRLEKNGRRAWRLCWIKEKFSISILLKNNSVYILKDAIKIIKKDPDFWSY